ncbi:protein FAM91A1-like isoform X2 [Apostichopus japonicus]|uniref:protein FAM91A1-like isoform X2 n=1 Tax=Stichopus japonicus TaxID=307972 RepID=UPI003AB47E41
MNAEVEFHIRNNYPWSKLPLNVKQLLANSQKEYDKSVVNYSIKNQLRYKLNLVKHVRKDERRYYEDLLKYSMEHLMLFPYHLSDIIVKGLRVTPFSYYQKMMHNIMSSEKSYDSLPNFTAADCLRLLGIGRNQYIDIMNQCRSSKKFFRRKPIRDLLPPRPVENIHLEPWWIAQAGYITEDDIKVVSVTEKNAVDRIIDVGPQLAGIMDFYILHKLFLKGLIYVDVPIEDEDRIIVPPLEGFVMNRVQGDYFETLLYKIFVSIDEHTTVAELATVLQIDLNLVKNAVSMYCRLGFAKRKETNLSLDELHSSWQEAPQFSNKSQTDKIEQQLINWDFPTSQVDREAPLIADLMDGTTSNGDDADSVSVHTKRIAFLFDSTLTAFLMMGNLSPGLKSHAVTMFEVGKLSDESLESFLGELEKVQIDDVAEGEAQRYFEHAITLKNTISFLRYNKLISPSSEQYSNGLGLDLLRCESLLGLDPATCSRVLQKNYELLISMAPLSNEIRPVSSCVPQHIGPAVPEVTSVWFKLYLYHMVGSGPPSLLLVKGTRLRRLPKVFEEYDRLLITTWGHDPGLVATSNALLTINDALSHSAVLIQAHGWLTDGETESVPFPLNEEELKEPFSRNQMQCHPIVSEVASLVDLQHYCGVITLIKTGFHRKHTRNLSDSRQPSSEQKLNEIGGIDPPHSMQETDKLNSGTLSLGLEDQEGRNLESEWMLLDLSFGIPLFNDALNKDVCNRMATHRLSQRDNLQELLHSSRRLTLELLKFISEHQDLPVAPEADQTVGPGSNQLNLKPSLPFPTRNLIFLDEKLHEWTSMGPI